MLRHHKVKSSIIICKRGKNLHYTDYSCRIRLSQDQTTGLCSSQILGFLQPKSHTPQRVCDRRDMPWQTTTPVSGVSAALGVWRRNQRRWCIWNLLAPPLWPHSHTTGGEMYNNVQCPFLCVTTALTGEFAKEFLLENGNYFHPSFHPSVYSRIQLWFSCS